MPTRITFAAKTPHRNLTLTVTEGPDEVFEALDAAKGAPFPVTRARPQQRVYVNPSTIAFWAERSTGRPASPPPT